jgi:hypothetical protein
VLSRAWWQRASSASLFLSSCSSSHPHRRYKRAPSGHDMSVAKVKICLHDFTLRVQPPGAYEVQFTLSNNAVIGRPRASRSLFHRFFTYNAFRRKRQQKNSRVCAIHESRDTDIPTPLWATSSTARGRTCSRLAHMKASGRGVRTAYWRNKLWSQHHLLWWIFFPHPRLYIYAQMPEYSKESMRAFLIGSELDQADAEQNFINATTLSFALRSCLLLFFATTQHGVGFSR